MRIYLDLCVYNRPFDDQGQPRQDFRHTEGGDKICWLFRKMENRAKEIEKFGIMAIDALHIACAEMAKADFFVTCDDLLVRKGMANKERLKVKIIGLMEFLAKEVFKT